MQNSLVDSVKLPAAHLKKKPKKNKVGKKTETMHTLETQGVAV